MIVLKNLTKSFSNEDKPILEKVDLSINKGDFVTIMGKSGSGKSTLLNIIGLLDRKYDGEYFLKGQKVLSLHEKDLNKTRIENIGYIFQSFNLINELTIFENIALPLIYRKVKKYQILPLVNQYAKALKIENLLNKFPAGISGGEQQRVSIARTLVTLPEIILADEPTGNVDKETRNMIINLLSNLNKSNNMTICLVTHDKDIAKVGNIQIKISDGKISHLRNK